MPDKLIVSSSIAGLTDGPGKTGEIERAKVSVGVFLPFIIVFYKAKPFP